MLAPRPSRTAALRVVVVDDYAFALDAMTRLLSQRRSRYSVVASVGSASEAIAACGQFQPDLLVLDINLPDQNGIDALPAIRRVAPGTRVLLCSGYSLDGRIADIVQSGADGFVEKAHGSKGFLEAVERVGRGERYFCSRSAGNASQSHASPQTKPNSAPRTLSKREWEVLILIAQGLTNKEIASNLGISVFTVGTHRSNLLRKLQVRNGTGLVSAAFKLGLARRSPRLR